MDLRKIAHSVRLSVDRIAKAASALKGGAKESVRVAVVVQCRLSSTRLPRKALLPLGGKPLVEWTLCAMERVKADVRYLACDTESAGSLAPIAQRRGWQVYAGDRDDVLKRFCDTIDVAKADVVVRATADNPFLFYEAAGRLLDEFIGANEQGRVDYMTYTGLPHGSGVEVFLATSLKDAAARTELAYDREHVGPALYAHQDRYTCVFLEAPECFRAPTLRTTVDTEADYRRALRIVEALSGDEAASEPYTAEAIMGALATPAVAHPALLIPCVKQGCGTGHVRRCIDLAVKNRWDIYIPRDASLAEAADLLSQAEAAGLRAWQVVDTLDDASSYAAAVTDLFVADEDFVRQLATAAPVIAIDEGAKDADFADYLLDVIPSAKRRRQVNRFAPSLIPLPHNRRQARASVIKNALVCLGGEDKPRLLIGATRALLECGVAVTAISPCGSTRDALARECGGANLTVSEPVPNLKESLAGYDLVVTHYGFTAFESQAAGCAVLLLATTRLHATLAAAWGFVCVKGRDISARSFARLLATPERLFAGSIGSGDEDIAGVVQTLAAGRRFACPICGTQAGYVSSVVARTQNKTYRRCSSCKMLYLAWSAKPADTKYDRAYFFEDYQRQYGKTYIEDFDAIKAVCARRIQTIGFLYKVANRMASSAPAVLDVGCAMGPFLQAASEASWRPFGADVSAVAVDYVQNTLGFPALCTAFPDSDFVSQFGVERFDAVTMWYVIEHFKDLDAVLKKVAAVLKPGGIFAFSTPSAEGVSALFGHQHFFDASPADHYSLWQPSRVKGVLDRYGLKVVRVVSTGIHPERLPVAKRCGLKAGTLAMRLLGKLIKAAKLGDTFEVYAKRI